MIFRYLEDDFSLYLIIKGQVEILKEKRVLKVLETNEYFGESSFFTGK